MKKNLIKNLIDIRMLPNFLSFLTLKAPFPQNGQTRSKNSSATADELFECV